jgi:oligopeptide transport system substrate-binding protein
VRRRGWHLAVLVCCLLVAVACRDQAAPPPTAGPTSPPQPVPGEQQGPAAAGGTFRWALQEPQAIIPPEATDTQSLIVVDALFDSLTVWDENLEPAPAAAESWTSEDLREWTFSLREGATFHDGTPVTADDFKAAWEHAVRADRAGYHLRDVDGYLALRNGDRTDLAGVSAPDPRSLQVRLVRPNADFPAVVAHPALGPIHVDAWSEDPQAYSAQPLGNGPFQAAEAWARGQFIRLASFGDWTNGRAGGLDEVVFQFMDRDTAYLAFQQRRLDFTELPAGALDNATEAYGASADGYTGPGVLIGETAAVYYLAFDLTQAPFEDPEVRRAVSLAVDRAAIARENLESNVTPARSLVSPAVPGARLGTCTACRLDRRQARQILEDREIGELRLWFNRGGGHERVARQVRADLGTVGVRLAFQTEEFPDYLELLESGEAGFFRFGWTAEYPTLDDSLRPLLHSTSIPGPGRETSYNYGRYVNADVDALLDAARATADPEERALRYVEAERLAVGRDQVVVPLFNYRHRAVVSDRVQDFRLDAMGRANLHEVTLGAPD